MTIQTIIIIFIVGFITLFAAYKYGGKYPIFQYAVYIIVIIIFLVVLCDIAGILPSNYLNKRV